MITEQELQSIDNMIVFDSFIKAKSVLAKHSKIVVSISGGSDSDIVLDLIEKVREERHEVHYVWYDTGIEYQATKNHLKYLEDRYGITIERQKAIKPIPTCTREFGQPFISKFVSENIERLQRHGFKWEDKSFDELMNEYDGMKSTLMWWTNSYVLQNSYHSSQFNINRNKWLKEFLLKYPPTFPISAKCCTYSKKKPAKRYADAAGADLSVVGVRKNEGGVRSVAYDNCYSYNSKFGVDQYRPLFWYSDDDKRYYEQKFGIVHSDCYTKYGLKRTGCVGCPFSKKTDEELKATEIYEPNLTKACKNVFKDAYEYTRAYRAFYAVMQEREKNNKDQVSIYD